MRNIIYRNDKGISIVESIVAMLLLTIGILAIMSMQPTSLKTGAKADNLGRGVMLLHKELMIQEAWIMNPCNDVTTGTVNKTVNTSDEAVSLQGDTRFNVSTVTSAVAGTTNTWRVSVNVSWPPLNAAGITDNLIVTRQEAFRLGCI
jgi:Tfp pilus assembly protein PilV